MASQVMLEYSGLASLPPNLIFPRGDMAINKQSRKTIFAVPINNQSRWVVNHFLKSPNIVVACSRKISEQTIKKTIVILEITNTGVR